MEDFNGLGFKNFESAKRTLSGIEVVHMLLKNQMFNPGITMWWHNFFYFDYFMF